MNSLRTFLSVGLRGGGWRMPTAEEAAAHAAAEEAAQVAVASAVREARVRSRRTQEHLAAESGVSVRTVRRIEASGRASFENLRCVCATLDIALPEPPAQASKPMQWPEAAKAVVIMAMWVFAPMLAAGLFATTRRHRVFAMSLGFGLALLPLGFAASAAWNASHLDASGMDGAAQAFTLRGQLLVMRLCLAMASGFASTTLGAVLGGIAWRATSPKVASVLAAVAMAVLGASGGPLLHIAAEVQGNGDRNAARIGMVFEMRKYLSQRDGESQEAQRERTLAVMPLTLKALDLPVPPYMADRDTYKVWLDSQPSLNTAR